MNFLKDIFTYDECKTVYGLTNELCNLYIYNYFINNNKNIIVLTSNLYEANNIYKTLSTYTDDVLLFPMDDFLTSVAIAVSPDLKVKRLEVLEKLKKNHKKYIVVTSLMGYLRFLPNKDSISSLNLTLNMKIKRDEVVNVLESYGYKRESIATTTGEYAVRGYIIDVFGAQMDSPVRIEFFGDEIDSIKEYDENTQRSSKILNEVEINKFDDSVCDNPSSIVDYIESGVIFKINNREISIVNKTLENDIFEYNVSKKLENKKYMYSLDEIKEETVFKIDTLNSFEKEGSLIYDSKELDNFNSDFEKLKEFCLKHCKNKKLVFALENQKQIDRISELFDSVSITNFDALNSCQINIVKAEINKGFMFEDYIVISPFDIENVTKRDIKYKNAIKIGQKIKSFNDLKKGDFIVHEQHGIGRYVGLKSLKVGHFLKDFIELEYLDNDKVYVPVENIDKIYKYADSDSSVPKLNKLNSPSWAKKKLETRKKIKNITAELVDLYSKRSKITGPAFSDFDEEFQFALDFPYTLTKDQEKTVNEIFTDLRSAVPMDRLLCGDVGYGKTEVAFRAMFKSVMNGVQVAYLCPTTILSKQQYESALERFKNFPVNIKLLNRHLSTKKVKEVFEGLENGSIDIVIGTHKLLNKQIKFKNLGLLVIDEEQRFGVTHKERIKSLKTDVNVLTLSATPIPRTLKLAMSGLRGLSVLDTPPINRYPVQTYVIEENELLIKDAVYKELARGGQVFVLINNIEKLDSFLIKLKTLVKDAKIISGHGQMQPEELNEVMEKFVNGDYDILVCTTIIETGIDIPNANTIIVLDADRFGLSQLYQIRGRVGRSDRIAYAYMMYDPAKILSEFATKRLSSIKEFTELGSGYKIAMRDLSIRGAGDLLGSEQAGFIEGVGLDLYTKMINEEMAAYNSGKDSDTDEKTKPKNMLISVNTHISDDYVSDENVKIEIHKMINSIKNKSDIIKVKDELEDRFGKLSEDITVYMYEMCVENILDELEITDIKQTPSRIEITLPKSLSEKMNGEKLFLQTYNINPKFNLSYADKKIKISLNLMGLSKHFSYYIYDLLMVVKEQL